ncbi:hypothetical protein JCM11251_002666 [Rhodosporidiobolus azoricus]
MARTKVSVIPQPDPSTFEDLLTDDLHLPINGPPSSLRRWLPSLLWRMGHQWITDMEQLEGIEPTAVPSEPVDFEPSEKIPPTGTARSGATFSASTSLCPNLSASSSALPRGGPSRPWLKKQSQSGEPGNILPSLSRAERARRREERSQAAAESQLVDVEEELQSENDCEAARDDEGPAPPKVEEASRAVARSAYPVRLLRKDDPLPLQCAPPFMDLPRPSHQPGAPVEVRKDDYILPFQLPPSSARLSRKYLELAPAASRAPFSQLNLPSPSTDAAAEASHPSSASRDPIPVESSRDQYSGHLLPSICVQPATFPPTLHTAVPSKNTSHIGRKSLPPTPVPTSPSVVADLSSDLSDLPSSGTDYVKPSVRERPLKATSTFVAQSSSNEEVADVSGSEGPKKRKSSFKNEYKAQQESGQKRTRRFEPAPAPLARSSSNDDIACAFWGRRSKRSSQALEEERMMVSKSEPARRPKQGRERRTRKASVPGSSQYGQCGGVNLKVPPPRHSLRFDLL